MLLDEGPTGYIAFLVVIAIWGLELFMNLRQGSGWTYWAHLILVGPLWLLVSGYFFYALTRKFLR